MAVKLNKPPKAKSLWILVRRLLRRSRNPPPPASAALEDGEGEKSGLLSRSSLEQLLVMTDDCAPGDDGDGDGDVCRCAKKPHGQPVAVLLPALARPEASAAAVPSAAGAAHRRFVFGGFRRRLLIRRPWRPMLVAIPE
ncbi:uncharacterized protein [Zea mays]|jgi:hypothetical protein|uniref:Uncharacterized protein n=1 Tax=Zea mays TaxID=4577 RepID=A0A1D6MLV4_MAIZE|nr:uncharacterized protein LOC103649806 [Zea mays]ONM30192.1 hypothetical protein ZEAMMB73_Zm00001d039932 [Zea mays]|eukprot:XP_008673740.1 uncharacterized protein LOC103649806 [Zea mays]